MMGHHTDGMGDTTQVGHHLDGMPYPHPSQPFGGLPLRSALAAHHQAALVKL